MEKIIINTPTTTIELNFTFQLITDSSPGPDDILICLKISQCLEKLSAQGIPYMDIHKIFLNNRRKAIVVPKLKSEKNLFKLTHFVLKLIKFLI